MSFKELTVVGKGILMGVEVVLNNVERNNTEGVDLTV